MKVELIGIEGLPEIVEGDDLAAIIVDGVSKMGESLRGGDVLVITQKIISKAEGRLVQLSEVVASPLALRWAAEYRCDARVIELVLRESRRIVRMERGVLITETHHGWVCANGGVDVSNVDGGATATLLPQDPGASAYRIREGLGSRSGTEPAVVISDTFGRPWREGLVNVAIGVAGLVPLRSYVGRRDPHGFPLQATLQALADEVAAAAGLVSGKLNRVPVALVRGLPYEAGPGSARELMRSAERDLFR